MFASGAYQRLHILYLSYILGKPKVRLLLTLPASLLLCFVKGMRLTLVE